MRETAGESRFVRVEAGQEAEVADWIASDEWPYHGMIRPTREEVLERGRFTGDEDRAFWICAGREDERIGLVVLHELADTTPIFDLRIRARHRGRGFGRQALRRLATHVFTETEKHRIEGHARVDNVAMRSVFRACGWVMEAYYRKAWPDRAGGFHDGVAHALLTG